MPIFDYECKECEITEEHLVSKATTVVICKDCATEMVKLFTSKVSFNLKGKGFYKPGFSGYK